MTTIPIPSSDMTWLLMDRPNNLMYVHGVLWLEQTPDWDTVLGVMQERLVERFPAFSRRAVEADGGWVWQEDPDFSLDNQVRHTTLPEPGTDDQLQEYMASRFGEPLSFDHPLWEMDLIEGLEDGGAIVFARFHHGIADGVRLVQVLLGLLDPLEEGAVPSAVGRKGKKPGPADVAKSAAKGVLSGATDFVQGAVGKVTESVGSLPQNLSQGWFGVPDPVDLTDAVTDVASEDNMLVNSWRSVSRLTLSGRSVDTVWSGTPGVEKKVTWISGLSLESIRATGKRHGVTINDVMLSAVSLGVTEYLSEKGEDSVDQVCWNVPVSLKPIDADIPKELGNHFAVVMLPMPLGIREPHELLLETHSRMNRIKNSAEPMIIYGVQKIVAETPAAVSVRLTNLVANKTVGVITNVPGPRVPMALAGTLVTRILGWVPTTADQPLGLCIFSYNGTMNIGIAGDAGLVPDPDRLAELIEQAIDTLAAAGVAD